MGTPLNLLHFTDPHLFEDRGGSLRGICTLESLRQTIDTARATRWPPDAILVTGDIAQDEQRATYDVFRECFGDLGVPVLCLPGNHDNVAYMRDALADAPFQFCGHWQQGGWVIVMLNTHRPGKASGRLAPDELQRLRDLLAGHPDQHFLMALHHHPVPSRSRWLDTVPLRNPDDLFAIVEPARNARCLLWGHVHQAYDGRRDDLLLLATPSTCGQFAPRSDEFAIDPGKPPGFRWLQLFDDGTVASAVHWCNATAPA